jgi:class 3 adenylate cyclase
VPSTALIDIKARTIDRKAELVLRPEAIEPPTAEVAGMGASVTVENRTGAMAVVQLEERFWPSTATTAALLSTLQEFRDLFAADVLAPGLEVGIERLAFLFTDIAGSTKMYEQVGQARAFRIVQDHFRLILGAIRDSHGAIVKTIGDAVMAVFPTAAQAVEAAFAMQRAMKQLEGYEAVDPQHVLKVGVHVGPCLAVTLNDRLDYFGTTVNMAARVEHEAGGGQIVITRDTYLEPGVAEIVQSRCSSTHACDVQLRGISAATSIVCIEPDIVPED